MLESIHFPEPVIYVAIEPRTTADQDKMGEALQTLAEEDPTFRVTYDENTGQTMISGMGELHLEVLVDRMMREFRVQANVGRPQVAYRETITRPVAKAEYRYVKQTGGHGQYGHVVAGASSPADQGSGIVFENSIMGGSIPREYIPAVEKGVREAAEGGVLAGYPMVDIKVDVDRWLVPRGRLERDGLQDGRLDGLQGGHAEGPTGAAGADDAGRGIVPEEFMGDVIGDLAAAAGIDRRHGAAPGQRPGHPRRWCRWPRCSATPPTCAR